MDNNNEAMYPAESTVGDQCRRKPSLAAWEAPRTGLSPEDLRRRIAAAAYELYLRRGKRRGHDLEDWLDGEAFVLSQLLQRSGDAANGEQS